MVKKGSIGMEAILFVAQDVIAFKIFGDSVQYAGCVYSLPVTESMQANTTIV